mgnify:CR=1 FL=1
MISTGEGGFILTNDEEIANRLKLFSRLGINKDKLNSGFGEEYGLHFTLNAMAAAFGITEIERLNTRIKRRNIRLAK